MSSIQDEYRNKKIYRHSSSVAARTTAKPAAGSSGQASLKSRQQLENSKAGEEARTARRHLSNEQATRRTHAPHVSYDQQELAENNALDRRLKEQRKARAERHTDELNAAKERALSK